MSNVRLSRQHATKLAGFSAAVILAFAGGCGGENESLKQIEKAEQTVGALTADGTFVSLSDSYRRAELTKVHDTMNALAGSGPESVRAAAFSIASRAKAGIASLDAKVAGEADKQLDGYLTGLRSGLNNYTMQKSIAESNTGAGTQGLIKTLQTSLEANKKNAAEASKAASKVQATVDELTTRSKSVSAQAAAKREEATSIAARMQGVSATEGLEILKQSAAVRAQADAFEQQASDLGTQLGLAQAELARARSTATALDEQTKQLQGEIASAQARLEEEHKLADNAGKAADTAFAAIKQQFTDLTTFRSGTLDPAHQAAVTSSQKALELAKQATAKAGANPQSMAAGNTGKLASASMQENYADALVSQARAQDLIAGTLGLVAGAKPALPNTAEFASAAEAARKASDDTLAQAREIYGTIKESLDGITDEKLKTRLAETSRLLESLSSKQGVKAVEPVATTPGATPAAPAAPGSEAAVADIRKLLDQMQDKFRAGDLRGTAELHDFASDAEKASFMGMMGFSEAVLALDSACQEKFSKSFSEIMGGGGAMAQMPDLGAARSRTSSDYTVVVAADGNTATATPKTSLGPTDIPLTLRRKDGAWRFTVEGMPAGGGGMFAMLTPIFKTLAADVKAGKYESPDQLKTAIGAQFGSLMGGGARPPGGAGGGGGEDDPNK